MLFTTFLLNNFSWHSDKNLILNPISNCHIYCFYFYNLRDRNINKYIKRNIYNDFDNQKLPKIYCLKK
jgi:hypothetical protein